MFAINIKNGFLKKYKITKKGNKMSKNKISIFFVLDETGSMAGCIQQTISGFNEYLNTLKEDKKSKYKLSLLKFNSGGLTQVCDDMPLKRVPELSLDNYRPANMTPLYDAIGHGINLMNSKRKVLFVIMTDGEENCSKEYDRSDIFKLVANQKKAGWQFAFLGADQDAWIAGGKIGKGRGCC